MKLLSEDVVWERAWAHAWRYFNLHATQRMSVFNFYLVVVGLLTASMVTVLAEADRMPLGGALGVAIIVVSFVFWRFDQRTNFLIKLAEKTLKDLETSFPEDMESAKIFGREAWCTAEVRRWYWPVTYAYCLRIIFVLFAVIGLAGVCVALDAQPRRSTAGVGAAISSAMTPKSNSVSRPRR